MKHKKFKAFKTDTLKTLSVYPYPFVLNANYLKNKIRWAAGWLWFFLVYHHHHPRSSMKLKVLIQVVWVIWDEKLFELDLIWAARLLKRKVPLEIISQDYLQLCSDEASWNLMQNAIHSLFTPPFHYKILAFIMSLKPIIIPL